MSAEGVLLQPIVAFGEDLAAPTLMGFEGLAGECDLESCGAILEEVGALPRVGRLFLDLRRAGGEWAGIGAGLHHSVRRQGFHESDVVVVLPILRTSAQRENLDRFAFDLRDHGFGLALAGYGCGLGDLTLLQRFPVDFLKMDSVFVRDVSQDPRKRTIVRATLEMAQRLGVSIVFEGVETSQELAALHRLGAVFAQGRLFSAPARADELAAAWGTAGRVPLDRKSSVAAAKAEPQRAAELDAQDAHELANLVAGVSLLAEQLLGRIDPGDPLHEDLLLLTAAGGRAAELTQRLQRADGSGRGAGPQASGAAPGMPSAVGDSTAG